MVFQIAANHLWQSAILVSAVLMLSATVRGMSAATRYLLAFAALVAAAMLPMAAWLPRMAEGGLSPLQAVWNPAAISTIESASRQVRTPTPLWSDWHLAELSALALSIWC